MTKDFYSVLSVPRDAKPPQIKARFRELARERHPDRFQGADKAQAELEFQDITEAFNVLMDPVRRRQHDLELDKPTEQAVHDPRQVARVYINRGVRAYKKGNYPEAADNFERATTAEPQNHQAWHHLALVCIREKRWLPKAQKAIDRACELRPDHVPYLKLAGKVYAQSGMTPRAKQYYNRALELADTDPTIRKALEALGERPKKGAAQAPKDESEQEKGKAGLFRKIW
jgi:curved DNA-binding protein CbpA